MTSRPDQRRLQARAAAGGRRARLPGGWRLPAYVAAALAIAGVVALINRPGPKPRSPAMDVDPQSATRRGPHDHEKLGTACLCDPEIEIRQALKDRADFAETHRELGDRFYARGQYDFALGRYRRAVELDKSNARAYYGLGLVAAKLGDYAQAEARLRQAADLAPGMTDIQISLGVLAYRAGDFAEARRRWEAALRIDGKNDYARLLLTRLPTLEKFDRGGPQTADHRPQTYGREGDRTPR